MQVKVKCGSYEHYFQMESNSTILDLKYKVAETYELDQAFLKNIVIQCGQIYPLDDKKLSFFKEEPVFLLQIMLGVLVHSGAENHSFQMSYYSTVKDLKDIIIKSLGKQINDVDIISHGEELKDDDKLHKYEIFNGMSVYNEGYLIDVTIKYGHSRTYIMRNNESIFNLRKYLATKYGFLEKNIADVIVRFGDTNLQDHTKLEDFERNASFTLTMNLNILVHSDSNVYSFTISSDDKVSSMKAIIRDKTGIPFSNIHLQFNGNNLKDNEELNIYGMENNCTVIRVAHVRGGL